jgi:uncharacterized membrane protein YqhA
MKKSSFIFLTLINFAIFCFFTLFIAKYSRSIINNLYLNLNNPGQLDKLIMNLYKQIISISGISFFLGVISTGLIYTIYKNK